MLGLAPVKISLYIDLIYQNAIENDLSAEIIVEEGTLRPLLRNDEKRLRELAADGHIEILVSDEILRYALWWMKSSQQTVAGATVYEDSGIKGLILNSAPEAVEWAQNEYESRREAAEHRSIDELLDK